MFEKLRKEWKIKNIAWIKFGFRFYFGSVLYLNEGKISFPTGALKS